MDSLHNILNLRTKFEEITSDYKMENDKTNSDINTLKWFIKNGYKSNSLRENFEEAKELATIILVESKKLG
jgi:hypothetical protein